MEVAIQVAEAVAIMEAEQEPTFQDQEVEQVEVVHHTQQDLIIP